MASKLNIYGCPASLLFHYNLDVKSAENQRLMKGPAAYRERNGTNRSGLSCSLCFYLAGTTNDSKQLFANRSSVYSGKKTNTAFI